MSGNPIRVTVWNEFRHEKTDEEVQRIYPQGIHEPIAAHLNQQKGVVARAATLDEAEQGLSLGVLEQTDVLIWWGHTAHEEVKDATVARVQDRVLQGMGILFMHSAHVSKPFKTLMGTTGALRWREAGEKERIWNVEPSHPIAAGIGDYFELPNTEMYGERFDVPTPDKVIFISWFAGGEVFRSGCVWERGHGRIFYFRPGHETFPIYHDATVLRVITNAVYWLAPRITKKEEPFSIGPIENLSR